MKTTYFGWLLLLFFSSTLAAQTCDSSMSVTCDCASKDLSPAGIMLGHEHPKDGWKISYRYMSTNASGNAAGTASVDDNYIFNNYLMAPKNMRMDMHMIMAMYGITNKLSVMAMFNYNVMTMNMSILPGTMHMHMDGGTMVMSSDDNTSMRSHSSGLGDTKLYAVYSLMSKKIHHVILSAGFNLPTGSIRVKGASDDMMYSGARMPYMMQMGSGSFDFMPGVTYLLKANKFSFSTQVTTVLRPFNNALNYHLGNEYSLNVWGAYQWFPWISTSLRMEGNSVGAISGQDVSLYQVIEPDANPACYGGENINGYLGLNFYLNKGFLKNNKLSVEYGMPLYQNFNGIQLVPKSTIYAGWLISF
ncbi:MAG: hypothetical protein JWP12_3872 [Bacteroidetes bacterium]|nr:hypothetical protein [Bacteroidota bacterium]